VVALINNELTVFSEYGKLLQRQSFKELRIADSCLCLNIMIRSKCTRKQIRDCMSLATVADGSNPRNCRKSDVDLGADEVRMAEEFSFLVTVAWAMQ
jgi:hypothetical protein